MLKQMAIVTRRAFTLVEILIVVVILGVLAAVVVPQFASASEEAAAGTTVYELAKLRRAMDVYQARWDNQLPVVEPGNGTWGALVSGGGEYLKSAPLNPYVGGANARVIAIADSPDTTFQREYGWIFDQATGQVWAGGFDEEDQPLPRE